MFGGDFYRNFDAVRAGVVEESFRASVTGFFNYRGKSVIPVFTPIKEQARATLVMLILDRGIVAYGDCIGVGYAAHIRRHKLVRLPDLGEAHKQLDVLEGQPYDITAAQKQLEQAKEVLQTGDCPTTSELVRGPLRLTKTSYTPYGALTIAIIASIAGAICVMRRSKRGRLNCSTCM